MGLKWVPRPDDIKETSEFLAAFPIKRNDGVYEWEVHAVTCFKSERRIAIETAECDPWFDWSDIVFVIPLADVKATLPSAEMIFEKSLPLGEGGN